MPHYLLKLPEVLISPLCEGGRVAFTEKNFQKLLPFDAVAFGMGSETSEDVFEGARYLLQNYTGRLILDADALNSLAKYGRGRLKEIFRDKRCDVLLTPHAKEFARLCEAEEMSAAGGTEAPRALAERLGCTVLLKGAATVISDGGKTTISVTGTPGQAKGGSGDVLSGLLSGICARKIPPFEAGCAASFLLGRAGEIAASKMGEYSVDPSDVVHTIAEAICSLS